MSKNGKVTTSKISSLTPDPNNANKGSLKGMKMLDDSLRKNGAGRSILIDRQGRIIAGNKTHQAAVDIGLEDVIIVKTNGDKLVAVQREDLDLDDPATGARELAYRDNFVSYWDFSLDPQIVMADMELGFDFEAIGVSLEELGEMMEESTRALLATDPANDPNAEWVGMPEFENEPKAQRTLFVHFRDNESVKEFADLMGQAITDKTKSLWYPYKPDNLHMDKNLVYANES